MEGTKKKKKIKITSLLQNFKKSAILNNFPLKYPLLILVG